MQNFYSVVFEMLHTHSQQMRMPRPPQAAKNRKKKEDCTKNLAEILQSQQLAKLIDISTGPDRNILTGGGMYLLLPN